MHCFQHPIRSSQEIFRPLDTSLFPRANDMANGLAPHVVETNAASARSGLRCSSTLSPRVDDAIILRALLPLGESSNRCFRPMLNAGLLYLQKWYCIDALRKSLSAVASCCVRGWRSLWIQSQRRRYTRPVPEKCSSMLCPA